MSITTAVFRRYKGLRQYRDSLFEFLSKRYVMIALTILPAFLLYTFITIIPVGWAFVASFFSVPTFGTTWTFVGLENFKTVIESSAFWQSLWRSVLFAGGSVAVQLVLGVAFAVVINRQFKYASLIRATVMLPYLIPTAVLGFIALWMGDGQWGIINWIPIRLGLIESGIPWFGSLELAMVAVILTSSWKFTIFVTIMVLARLQSIPEGYYEAARMAGASSYQRFRDVTLPNLKGVIFIVLLLRGVWMFNKFDIIYVLTQGGPGDATTTAPLYAFEVSFPQGQLGVGSAISVLLFLLLAVVAVIYFVTLEPGKEVRVE